MPAVPRAGVAAVTERAARERAMYAAGYRDGFAAGGDVGGTRVMLAVEQGWPPDLRPLRQYGQLRRARESGPCADPKCGACQVRRGWLARHGGDHTGRAVTW